MNLDKWIKENPSFLFCLDGYCGSGKTTLARSWQEEYGLQVVHMDDFYLPFHKRVENWKKLPGANMDFERLKKEILEPYRNHLSATYMAYNPHQDVSVCMGDILPDRPLLIEGSYSSHLSSWMDMVVFLKCDLELQKERLKKREKERYPMFEEIWMVNEHAFFKMENSEDKAQIVLDSSSWF